MLRIYTIFIVSHVISGGLSEMRPKVKRSGIARGVACGRRYRVHLCRLTPLEVRIIRFGKQRSCFTSNGVDKNIYLVLSLTQTEHVAKPLPACDTWFLATAREPRSLCIFNTLRAPTRRLAPKITCLGLGTRVSQHTLTFAKER